MCTVHYSTFHSIQTANQLKESIRMNRGNTYFMMDEHAIHYGKGNKPSKQVSMAGEKKANPHQSQTIQKGG